MYVVTDRKLHFHYFCIRVLFAGHNFSMRKITFRKYLLLCTESACVVINVCELRPANCL